MFSQMKSLKTKESFIFDTNQYSNEWKEASQIGFVPIFEFDGSVSRFEKDEADVQWQIRDNNMNNNF